MMIDGHPYLTRLNTFISPEEMTKDPFFFESRDLRQRLERAHGDPPHDVRRRGVHGLQRPAADRAGGRADDLGAGGLEGGDLPVHVAQRERHSRTSRRPRSSSSARRRAKARASSTTRRRSRPGSRRTTPRSRPNRRGSRYRRERVARPASPAQAAGIKGREAPAAPDWNRRHGAGNGRHGEQPRGERRDRRPVPGRRAGPATAAAAAAVRPAAPGPARARSSSRSPDCSADRSRRRRRRGSAADGPLPAIAAFG